MMGKEPAVSNLSEDIQKEIVEAHNAFRRAVQPTASNMLKLVWNKQASESAKKWAGKCEPKSSPMEERTVNGVFCGESISQSNFVRSWPDVIKLWHSSVSDFKYGVGAVDPDKNVYGYTQVVWYRTHEIGCALAYCPQSKHPFFYVCHYCPAGNILQQMATPYKQGVPCGDCPNNCEDKLCTNPCKYMDNLSDCQAMVEQFTCKSPVVVKQCEATCKCKSHIK
ncbi:cysteine-rich venom protein triflin-like [Hemicordylus capensis]|uniref:cysteine-rich venom protein triflin-like n=1 Tax=Hemicordylus capensis TaxID=884348 RepID=UPI002302E3B0|nr:cysteine-rich venom protein triflin-like [Hemicordylus capensis]